MHAGQSKQLADDIDSFIDEVLDTFPAAFDNPGYQRKKKSIDREFNDAYDSAITAVEIAAFEQSVALVEEKNSVGFVQYIRAFHNVDFEDKNNHYRRVIEHKVLDRT